MNVAMKDYVVRCEICNDFISLSPKPHCCNKDCPTNNAVQNMTEIRKLQEEYYGTVPRRETTQRANRESS